MRTSGYPYIAISVFALVCLVLLVGASRQKSFEYDLTSSKIYVHDGDTFYVTRNVGGVVKTQQIRLHGIDSLENKQRCIVNGGEENCPADATRKLANILSSAKDMLCIYKGKSYKRDVMQCFIGSLDIGFEMVRSGMAFHSRNYTSGRQAEQLDSAEAEAKAQGRGVWAQGTEFEFPWDYRQRMRERNAKK